MEVPQYVETSNCDFTMNNFVALRDLLKDSSQYFQSCINVNRDSGAYTYPDDDHLKGLFERSTSMLTLINKIISESSKEQFEIEIDCDTINSYLPMELRKNEIGVINRDEYVNVDKNQIEEFDEDENVYDNIDQLSNAREMEIPKKDITKKANSSFNDLSIAHIINSNIIGMNVKKTIKTNDKIDEIRMRGKHDCPFTGLPAKHLPINQSPKMGWLTMHLKGKRSYRFDSFYKRKYYSGLVMKQLEDMYCEWWLLMYAGENELKPRTCLQLNRFTVCADSMSNISCEQNHENASKRNLCKFKLNEKSNGSNKTPKSYCFITKTPEDCEKWINLMKPMSLGLPCDEPIRQLPMLPLSTDGVDGVEKKRMLNKKWTKDDVITEEIYEDPEAYFKTMPTQTADTQNNYDTPKRPLRKLSNSHDSITVPKIDSTPELDDKEFKRNNDILDNVFNEPDRIQSRDDSNDIVPFTQANTIQRTINVQPKGNKVHQLINQFAKNNQIELIRGGRNTLSKMVE